MALPVHGWFRFPAGFSAEWVRTVVHDHRGELNGGTFLDPFSGVGTAVLAAEEAGVRSLGLEAQPFILRVAKAKLNWYERVEEFADFAERVLTAAKREPAHEPKYPRLIEKCYSEHAIRDLYSLKAAWERLADYSAVSELAWLCLVSILRSCSHVGTAPWQYVLPSQEKAIVARPYDAFASQVNRMIMDMRIRQLQVAEPSAQIRLSDARTCEGIEDQSVGLVVTSPPYANNYDYADATRLEMTFLGEVLDWGDLHEKARKGLVRSCSQHVSTEKTAIEDMLTQLNGIPFEGAIRTVCGQLAEERSNHGGKKQYDVLIAAYFADMLHVWQALRRVCRKNAAVCFVVGDSAPYGVHVPVEEWMGQLAVCVGFKAYRFEKLRDRNTKWKNRKHRVPLQEGCLWVEG
ncbi:MAG: site-specific DNA-methyltransferase [Chloroflexi bacterium]|nr:site-specific DNA-methyltransferase [Chloroflexota bacterium]